jgi:hypothetical protein
MTTSGLEYRAQPRAIDVLREQIAPNASDAELEYLAQVGQRLGLDPIAGHIVLIGRWDKRANRTVHRPQVTADGRLVLADRTGELDGFTGPEWTGPRERDGSHRWLDLWDEDFPPHAARVFVYRRGREHPVNGTVRWIEFAQTDSNGNVLPTWKQMPSHMLGKVALSLGIRRAFPGIIPTGLEVDDVVEDDFAPMEEHRPVEVEDVDADADVDEDTGLVRPPNSDELETRLMKLSLKGRAGFKAWRYSRGLGWPPASPEALRLMAAEVAVIEEREDEEHQGYEPPVGSPID